MLKNVRLRLLPNVSNCLAWSPEGSLAIVSAEDVVILVSFLQFLIPARTLGVDKKKLRTQVPKFGAAREGSGKKNAQFWHARANLRQLIIDAMDDEDVVPAPAIIYSIGEEQGPGYAKEIVWSPLGFSRYRRCLLAVVVTNHKLYIFEPVGQVSADMRVLHELSPMMAEYEDLPKYDNEEVRKVIKERLRGRCRAAAWSPPCITEGHRWGESLLAAANEFLEIVLFRFLFLPVVRWENGR
jgi:hypothetical protein